MKLPKLTNILYVLLTIAAIVFVTCIFALGGKNQCEDINGSACEYVAYWQPVNF